MAAEQLRLLRVRPVAAGDHERHSRGARGALHAVERERDVGPHRLALAEGQRPVVAASLAEGVEEAGRELGLGDHVDGDAPADLVAPDLDDLPNADADADRGKRVAVREADRRLAGAVRVRDALGGCARQLQVGVAREVARVRTAVEDRRLEQPRVRLVHGPRTRERREVRRTLRAGLASNATSDRPEHEDADEHRSQARDEQHRRLAQGRNLEPPSPSYEARTHTRQRRRAGERN